MSQENVDLIRSFMETWGEADIASVREIFHPDVVMRMEGDWPEPGPYFGREAVTRWDTQFRDTWESVTVEPVTEFVAAGDRVVGRYALHGVGQGPPSRLEVTIIHTIRNRQVREIEFFWDHAEALEAMGLSE